MADPGNKGRCGCCSFIFTLGLTALSMWLSLRTSNPKCSIQTFYLSSLNTTLNDQTTLNLSLRLDNTNIAKGIRYDTLNVTVYDFPNKSHVVGNISIRGFYQGHKKKATKPGQGTANTTVLAAVYENGTGSFRVDMATTVKFKILFWYTKKHRIRVGADVVVNASGVKIDPKGIRLKSMAPKKKMGSFFVVVVRALVNFLFFTLINSW